MKKQVSIYTLCILLLLSLTGCEHKELCFSHPHTAMLDVDFNWDRATDASPRSMSLYLFPKNGGRPLRYEFSGCKGGKIRVAAGRYDALCLNSDTEGIYYLNTEKITSFEVTTRSTQLLSEQSFHNIPEANVPRVEGKEDERVALAPDLLWSDNVYDIEVSASDDNRLTLYPEISMHICTIEIRNADNLKYVSGISASISTMAGGVLVGHGHDVLSEERVTIPFEADISPDKTTITGRLQSFGHCPTDLNSHNGRRQQMVLYI